MQKQKSTILEYTFSIEYEFDATVLTIVDEGTASLQEDIIVTSFAECITIEQHDPKLNQLQKVTFWTTQIRYLAATILLPEGIYSHFLEHNNVERTFLKP